MIPLTKYYLCSVVWAAALVGLFGIKKIQPNKKSDWYFFYAILICIVVSIFYPKI